VNIDDAVTVLLHKRWRKNAHVLCQHNIIRRVTGNNGLNFFFLLFTADIVMADAMKGNIKFFREIFQVPVIAHHPDNIGIK